MGSRTRLFVLAAAFGAAALITATGAFTAVSAERTATVTVASDDAALLALSPHNGPNGAYAELSNGELVVGFDGVSADGVNQNAKTTLGDVFNVTNQGTQPVAVSITETGDHPGLVTFETAGGTGLDDGGSASLGVGETIEVTIVIDTTGETLSSGASLLDSVTIHAEAGA